MMSHKLDNGATVDSDVTLGNSTDNLFVGGRLVASLSGNQYSGFTLMITGAPVEQFEDYDSAYGRLLQVAERAAGMEYAREESRYRPGVSVGVSWVPMLKKFVTVYEIETLRSIWPEGVPVIKWLAVARNGILLEFPKL